MEDDADVQLDDDGLLYVYWPAPGRQPEEEERLRPKERENVR